MRNAAKCNLLVFLFLWALSLSCAGGTTNTTILEDGSYFNGTSFIPFKELVIQGGKIVSINSKHTQTKGQRISVAGKYVMPGLIDAHVHLGGAPLGSDHWKDAVHNANSLLNCGVTTFVDLFYEESKCKELKQQLKYAPEYYPTPIMSGPILTAPEGHGTEYGIPTRTITTMAEAHTITNDVIDSGADVIKVVYEAYIRPAHTLTKDMVKEIVAVAHQRNKKVFAHVSFGKEAQECAESGVDVLAHLPFTSLSDEQVVIIKKSGVALIPTITVMQAYAEGFDSAYVNDPLLLQTNEISYSETFTHQGTKALRPSFFYAFRANLKKCVAANIPIVAGTDAGNANTFYGYSLHHEIAQYVKAGMSNAEALRSATENIRFIFPNIKTGKIQQGYDADLLVLNANPLEKISNTKSIAMIFHKGQPVKKLAN